MRKTFIGHDAPLLTAMIQAPTPEAILAAIREARQQKADAVGIQFEQLELPYHTPETFRTILQAAEDLPTYVTYYRGRKNAGKTDEQLAETLVELARAGATLCDVVGDLFDRQADELAVNSQAIARQKDVIDRIHQAGSEVLISSHIHKFTPAERIIQMAQIQENRGADVVKLVSGADTMEQQLENLRITLLLKTALQVPYLFLSGGECSLHRRIGPMLGCSLALCVTHRDTLSTPVQPLLGHMQSILQHFREEGSLQ